jgi:flagellin FlaB
MKNICKIFKRKDVGAIGVGAMIVFISMVLVAGIAASVLIQTSTVLESQAMATGQETTDEISGGINVYDVGGHVSTDIDALAITVCTRAGSPGIDLNETVIMLSDGTTETLLFYDYADPADGHYNDSVDSGDGDVFGVNYSDLENEEFGILVLEDADGSLSRYAPVINAGDKVVLYIDTIACFGGDGIAERTDVFGWVYPEYGSPGVISFRTPASYTDTLYDLQ